MQVCVCVYSADWDRLKVRDQLAKQGVCSKWGFILSKHFVMYGSLGTNGKKGEQRKLTFSGMCGSRGAVESSPQRGPCANTWIWGDASPQFKLFQCFSAG